MLSNWIMGFAYVCIFGTFLLLYTMKHKKLKRWLSLALVCGIILYLTISCGPRASERPFRQPVENITAVTIRTGDIYDRETGEYGILKELSEADGIELIHALQELEIGYTYYTAFLDPHGEFLQIEYLNGEIEQLTPHNNFWIMPNGERFRSGYYLKSEKMYDEILKRYY